MILKKCQRQHHGFGLPPSLLKDIQGSDQVTENKIKCGMKMPGRIAFDQDRIGFKI
jgi:hypothetical protein